MAVSPSTGPHRRTLRKGVTVSLLALALVGALLTFWGWRGGSAVGQADTDIATAPPSAAASASPSPAPTEALTATRDARDRPTPKAPRRTSTPAPTVTQTPSPAATAQPTPTQAPAIADVQAGPVHVTISRGAEVLVDAPVALTQLNARDELNPPPGVVGWYGPPEWATVPGDLSTYPGVLAGHTSYDGAHDVFHRLGEVRAGDTITIGYADGEQATFSADADALSVPKNDVTEKADSDYAWVWRLPDPDRKVSLFSCDLGQGIDLTGHSVNNWVVQATRTA